MEQKKNPPPDEPDGKSMASEEQDLMDIFVAQGIKLVSEIAPSLVGKATVDSLGNAMYEVINKIETEGRRHGIEFPPGVLLHGSTEILGHLISTSKVQIEEDQIKAVIGIAVGRYIENGLKTGKVTQQDLAQVVQMAQQQGGGQVPATGGAKQTGLIGGGYGA